MEIKILESQVLDLVERARAGDRDAFGRLVADADQELRAAILAQVDPRLRARLDLEDLRQEVLTQAYASLASFEWRGEGSFTAWLCGIARRVVLSVLRKSREFEPLEIIDGLLAASDASPSHAARQEERFDRLESAFQGLSDDHRQVLRLARLEGLASQEIAERMGRSPEAVRQLLSRALRALRQSFGETDSFTLPDRRLENGGPDGR